MTVASTEGSELVTASQPVPSRARRTAVILVGIILATAICSIIGATLFRGTWWYSYPTDNPLDEESLALLESMTRELRSISTAGEAMVWLNAAADPNADPSAVWAYLVEAQTILAASSDPALQEAAEEVGLIIQVVRGSGVITGTNWLDLPDELYSLPEEPTTGD